MRRFTFPLSLAVLAGACLLACGVVPAVRADGPTGGFDQFVASWMGVVGVVGGDGETDEDAATFAIDGDDEDGEREDRPRRRHREGDRPHHGGGRPPHGPHHPGMGPPGGPDLHRAAMRGFHEIIRRLARIEEKLGIEDASPRFEGDRPRPPRGPEGSAERPQPRREMPEEMRRMMEERMQEGRRRMEQAKDRMEEARRRFQEMEEKIRQLEAEVARLKADR